MSLHAVMPSSTANCTCLKSGAAICHADRRLISPTPSLLRPNPNSPSAWFSALTTRTCPSAGSWPIQISGHCPDLRAFLEEQGDAYALAVPSTEVVCVQTKAGPLLADVGSIAQRALCPADWQRL